ncbi:MAG: pyridoxal-phosphate dependent enzyme [Candidatus Hodarchaeota archaeon]
MSLKDIEEAYHRIKNVINKTPVMTSRTLNEITGASVFLKCENFQRIGAFKFRGAYNALNLLSQEQKKLGIITHSSGNHAQAVALAASILGIHATIVMPKGAPINKINATKAYGAEVVFCDNSLESRSQTTNKLIEKHNYLLIHPFNNENVIRGAGTAAYELIKEIGSLDIIIAPLGGGGLLSGTAIATWGLNPETKVYGVEPSMADDALRSLQAGYIIPSTYPNTIADGLRTSLCERTFNYIKKYVDGILTVSELEILEAMRFLWERMKLVVEPSGAVPIAALLSNKIETKNKKIGVIISGGNVVLDKFFQQLEENLLNKQKGIKHN